MALPFCARPTEIVAGPAATGVDEGSGPVVRVGAGDTPALADGPADAGEGPCDGAADLLSPNEGSWPAQAHTRTATAPEVADAQSAPPAEARGHRNRIPAPYHRPENWALGRPVRGKGCLLPGGGGARSKAGPAGDHRPPWPHPPANCGLAMTALVAVPP